MAGYTESRRQMVDNQIRTTDVTAYNVLEAFGSVPRELFVPSSQQALAYSDSDITVSETRTMMQPSPLAKLLQLTDINANDLVLVIAPNSGYLLALAAQLGNTIVAVENDERLVEKAEGVLSKLGIDNVAVIAGDVSEGAPSQGPFDKIIIEGAVEQIPQSILDQLKDGGSLVTVDGAERRAEAVRVLRTGDTFSQITAFDTNAPVLDEFRKTPEFTF